MDLRCLFRIHDFVKVDELDERAQLRPGWTGNPGWNYYDIEECSRCEKKRKRFIGNWHEKRYCPHCKRQTRQHTYIFSEVGGYGVWFGQGDGHIGWDCIMCGNAVKDIPQYAKELYER